MNTPSTATRFAAGNQYVMERITAGTKPASAAPSRNRMM